MLVEAVAEALHQLLAQEAVAVLEDLSTTAQLEALEHTRLSLAPVALDRLMETTALSTLRPSLRTEEEKEETQLVLTRTLRVEMVALAEALAQSHQPGPRLEELRHLARETTEVQPHQRPQAALVAVEPLQQARQLADRMAETEATVRAHTLRGEAQRHLVIT